MRGYTIKHNGRFLVLQEKVVLFATPEEADYMITTFPKMFKGYPYFKIHQYDYEDDYVMFSDVEETFKKIYVEFFEKEE